MLEWSFHRKGARGEEERRGIRIFPLCYLRLCGEPEFESPHVREKIEDKEVSAILREVSVLLELKGGSFQGESYSNAADRSIPGRGDCLCSLKERADEDSRYLGSVGEPDHRTRGDRRASAPRGLKIRHSFWLFRLAKDPRASEPKRLGSFTIP